VQVYKLCFGELTWKKNWPFAFNYSLHISNILPHGDRGVPLERFTGKRASFKKYHTFGCLVIVKPPDKRNGKVDVNFRRGFFLGFTGTLQQIYYWDLVCHRVKRAYTVKYDECSTVMDRPSPNSRHLHDAMDGKDIPVEDQESGAPASFDLVSSGYPFINLKELVLQIRCDNDTFGIVSTDCADLTRAFILDMLPHSTGAALRGWRRNYAGAYIVQLEHIPVFNRADFVQACETVRTSLLTQPKTTITMTMAPERKEALRDTGCSPQLHVDQFRPVIRTLFEIREVRSITADEIPDDNEITHAIRSISVSDDIDVNVGTTPDLRNAPDIEYVEGTLPGSNWTRRRLKKLACWPRWK
jgi:hypothetical protein